mmetsp:Transcript_27299/g.49072  ORF Transcript_27299/g.49072 Transcript_27299/m.49072 type:complete len:211 (-) Transcript_27299:887-1519(-)
MGSNQELHGALRLSPSKVSTSSMQRLALIRERVNSLASRLPPKGRQKPVHEKFEDPDIRIRTPPKKHEPPEHCYETVDDSASIEDFLKSIKLENLVPVFAEHQISIQDLASITRQDLIELGVPLGPRNRILKYAEKLQVSDSVYNREASTEASSFLRPNSELSVSDAGSQSSNETLELLVKRLAQQQSLMMRAIEENRRTLELLKAKRPM